MVLKDVAMGWRRRIRSKCIVNLSVFAVGCGHTFS